MALHLPTHQAGLAGPHVFRNALLVIGVAILAVVLLAAALTIKPFATSSTTTSTPAQTLVEFRAGERDTWNSMAKADAAAKALIQFRADERNMK